MTKKIYKIIILLFFIIILFGFGSIVKAAADLLGNEWDVGGRSNISGNRVTEYDFVLRGRSGTLYDFDPSSVIGKEVWVDIYDSYIYGGQYNGACAGHGNTPIISSSAYYEIQTIIDIDTSWVDDRNPNKGFAGSVISYGKNPWSVYYAKDLNSPVAQMAYLAVNAGSSYAYKMLFARYIYQWLSSWNSELGLTTAFSNESLYGTWPGDSKNMRDQANAYADSVENYRFSKVSTEKGKASGASQNYVGPFRIENKEGSSITASASGYNVLGFATSVDGQVNGDLLQIPHNEDFYIVLDRPLTSAVDINLTKQFTGYQARIMFFATYSGSASRCQNTVAYQGNPKTFQQTITLQAENPVANFKLIKLDNDTGARLANVQFRFTKDGQYLKTDGTFTTNVNDNTIFTTDGNGEITLSNIPYGTYQYYEVSNPNSGYEQCQVIPANGTNFTIISYSGYDSLTLSRASVRNIYLDQTSQNRMAALSNEDFVKVAYRAILGREADSGGLAGWKAQLDQGRNPTSQMNVINGLVDSQEFTNNYQNTESYRQNLIIRLYENFIGRTPNPNSEVAAWSYNIQGYSTTVVYNRKVVGNIYITKKDTDTGAGLANVGFKFQNVSTGKYVRSSNGTISYVDSASSATEFRTDGNGNLTVTGVLLGSYRAYETSNPNSGYVLNTSPVTVSTNTSSYQRINNTYQYGNLSIRKYDQDTGANLANVEFTVRATSGQANGNYLYLNANGTVGYSSSRQTVRTNSSGTITLNNIWVGNYEIIEVNNPNYGYLVNSTPRYAQVTKRQTATVQVQNEYQLGNLSILKIDADNSAIKLANVEFTVRATSGQRNGQYVYQDSSGNVAYSTTYQTVKTNSQGLITLNSLWVGNYQVQEVSNPNYGYTVDSTVRTAAVAKRQTTNLTITNRKVYVKVSGYVWEDGPLGGKETERNDLYRNDVNDTNDKLLGNIIVRLKEGNNVLQQTTTSNDGSYIFVDVLIDKLSSYYIEFEYDGLKYENVIVHNDRTNGSKAAEGSARDTLNNKFAKVENGGTQDTVSVKDANNNTQYNIKYTLDPANATAEVTDSSACKITSTTTNAGYVLIYDRTSTETEIKNVNLGIYLRTQADLAIMQDLDNVKVEVAGYGHIYKYANRFENASSSEDDYYIENAWNVGVRFQNEYSSLSYTRPVYKADAYYGKDTENPIPASENLKVALTYKIAIRNEETIAGRVNQVVDYYDARYEIEAIGTTLDDNTGTVGNLLNYNIDSNTYVNGKYKKVTIETNILVDKSISNNQEQDKNNTQKYVYIQFVLDDDAVIDLLDDAEGSNPQRLENIAEVTSYTSYYDLNSMRLYAAVDKDSVPNNCTPGTKSTYEDDTDTAPTIALTLSSAREVTGTVFEDSAEEDILEEKNLREGNGILDSDESAIGGVKVQLMEVDDEGNVTENVARVFNETTNQWEDSIDETEGTNGQYEIGGFAPGKYVLKYTWGDGTYKIVDGTTQEYTDMVENYKATNIDEEMNNSETQDQTFFTKVADANEEPYLNKELSHALDNYETRLQIDEQLNKNTVTDDSQGYNYTTTVDINEMTSETPIMDFHIEFYDKTEEGKLPSEYSRISDSIKFEVEKMSFGIIRRPVQSYNVTKTLEKVKLTLANGQVLIDATLVEDAEGAHLEGQTQYMTYMSPTVVDGKIVNGTWRAELDAELIQGATIDMAYKFTTQNTSETDYTSQGYYNFGEEYYTSRPNEQSAKLADIVGISPSMMVDYLDQNSSLKIGSTINEQYGWEGYTIEQLRNARLVEQDVITRLQTGIDANGKPLDPVQIFVTKYYKDSNIYVKPAYYLNNTLNNLENSNIYMETQKVLSSSEDANFMNQLEVVLASKPGGSKIVELTPGNYTPNLTDQESDDSVSEELIITPNTGSNRNIVLPITVLIITFIMIGVGTYLIVVKIMKREFK